jgi:hypothetical protein
MKLWYSVCALSAQRSVFSLVREARFRVGPGILEHPRLSQRAATPGSTVVVRRAITFEAGCTTASALMHDFPHARSCSVPRERRAEGPAPVSFMNLTTDIAVVGGGPAGAIAALRLARLGHAVVLLHDACGRRRPACETFTASVAEQLAFLGLAAVLDRSAIRSAAEVELCWGRG